MYPWKCIVAVTLVLILALLAVVLHRLAILDKRVTELERHSQVPWQVMSEPTNPIHDWVCPVFEAKRKGEH